MNLENAPQIMRQVSNFRAREYLYTEELILKDSPSGE